MTPSEYRREIGRLKYLRAGNLSTRRPAQPLTFESVTWVGIGAVGIAAIAVSQCIGI